MVVSYRLPCPACKKNATVAPGLLTTRYQRVRCPYCFYEWHANKGMLVALETRPPPPINTASPRNRPHDAPDNMPDNIAGAGRRASAPSPVAGDTMPTGRNPAGAPFAINVSGTIKGNMGGDVANDNTSGGSAGATDIADDELLSLDLSRMNDTDYQQYQANQERLKKFKRKIKTPGSYNELHRGLDWFSIIGLILGLVVAAFLFLVLLIIFRDPIVRHIPQAEELYHWLSYFINRLLR
ncbi:MAG: hypothetical protein QM529_02365 [Hydrotalea sp.]|nr:hypothetical protein [Hydrotalea sp.]